MPAAPDGLPLGRGNTSSLDFKMRTADGAHRAGIAYAF
jgi:hypothetical protein